jgi:hypothetical protein
MYYSLVLATNEVVNTPQLVCSRLYRAHNLSCTVYTVRVYVCTHTCLQALYTPRMHCMQAPCVSGPHTVRLTVVFIYKLMGVQFTFFTKQHMCSAELYWCKKNHDTLHAICAWYFG